MKNKNYLYYRDIDNILDSNNDIEKKLKENFNDIIEPEQKEKIELSPFAKVLGISEIEHTQEDIIDMINLPKDQRFSRVISGQGLMIGNSLIDYSQIELDGVKNNDDINNDTVITQAKFFQNTLAFDYVLGEAIIPGSSVKGAIKSTFDNGVSEIVSIASESGYTKKELEHILFEHKEAGNGLFITYFDATIQPLEIKRDNSTLKLRYTKESITPMSSGNANPMTFIKVVPGAKINFNINIPKGLKTKIKLDRDIDLKKIIEILINNTQFGAKGNSGFGKVEKGKNA